MSCGLLQPPPPRPDHFDILGLHRRYSLTRKEIDSAWRGESRKTHPDKFAGKGALQKRMALQWTASLNDARRVLKDPMTRGWYLATGLDRPPERNAPKVGPEFLEQVFELSMAEPDDRRAAGAVLAAELTAEIDALFAAWEAGEGTLDEVPERLSRMKYVANLTKED